MKPPLTIPFLRALFALFLFPICLIGAAEKINFDIPVGDAKSTLKRFADQSKKQVLYSVDAIEGVRTNAVNGRYNPREGLERMLAGTSLSVAEDPLRGALSVVKKVDSGNGATRNAAPSEQPAVVPMRSTTSRQDESDDSTEVYTISPFTVTESQGDGYSSQQTFVGSRSAKDLSSIPASVSIINQQLISDLNAVDLTEAIKFAASGVTPNSVYDDFMVRGFRAAASQRNGVRMKSVKGQPMYDVERVEVIKGPAAMLTGNNESMGGTINAISRRPAAKAGGEAKLTVGEQEYFRGELNVTGPLFKSTKADILYRVTLGRASQDPKKEIHSVDETFIGGSMLAYLGPQKTSSLDLTWYVFRNDSYFYYADFLDITSTRFAVLNRYSTKDFSPGRQKDTYYDTEESFICLTSLNEITKNSNLRFYWSYGHTDSASRLISGSRLRADNITLERQDIPLDILERAHTLQLDYLHRLERKAFVNELSLGGDYRHQRAGQDLLVRNLPAIDVRNPDFSVDDTAIIPRSQLPPFSSTSRTTTNATSYYFQDNFSILKERLILVGGMRWIDADTHGINLRTNVRSAKDNPTFPTHKYGLVVKPLPGVSVYYTNAQNLYLQSGFTNEEIPRLRKNREGKLSEFGIKVNHTFNDRIKVFGDFAHFDMALTNVEVVTFEYNSRGELIKRQSERNTSKGWEATVGGTLRLGPGHLDALVTYYNADTWDASTKTAASDAVGEAYSVLMKYSWNAGALKGAMLGLAMNDQDAKINAPYLVDFPITYSSFAAYRLGPNWTAQLNLNNIADKRYVIGAATAGLVSAAEGFVAKLSLKYHW